MPRDGPLQPSPRPIGLGNDVGRIIGAVVIGIVLWEAIRWGLQLAVEAAIWGGA